ncbi:MAG: helix-turn-helix domain-containing protein [Gammaproteobacteria bacterium]
MVINEIKEIGVQLRAARKRRFPKDDLSAFALRIGVSRATLQKMEKGDLSVGIGKYFAAAQVLGLENGFRKLFESPAVDLFDD